MLQPHRLPEACIFWTQASTLCVACPALSGLLGTIESAAYTMLLMVGNACLAEAASTKRRVSTWSVTCKCKCDAHWVCTAMCKGATP
jgi:hypothetical protein